MIAIIDVSGTNLTSLVNAIKRLGYSYVLTHNEQQIRQASHVLLPGVGTARYGMHALRTYGLIEVLSTLAQPLLGICLGMQLLLESSDEGDVDCLGLIPGRAERIISKENHPVPHMGWNKLQWNTDSPLQEGLNQQDYVYFVHSFALKNSPHTVAHCSYSESFAAIINKNNIFGMQFHPEKSADIGLKLLNNFLSLEV